MMKDTHKIVGDVMSKVQDESVRDMMGNPKSISLDGTVDGIIDGSIDGTADETTCKKVTLRGTSINVLSFGVQPYDTVMVIREAVGGLRLFRMDEWQQLADEMKNFLNDSHAQCNVDKYKLVRFILAGTNEHEVDEKGDIILQQIQLEYISSDWRDLKQLDVVAFAQKAEKHGSKVLSMFENNRCGWWIGVEDE